MLVKVRERGGGREDVSGCVRKCGRVGENGCKGV